MNQLVRQLHLALISQLFLGKAMSNQNILKFRKLDSAAGEIRLLKLLPVQHQEDAEILNCELEYASMLQPPPYTALSYLWGDSTLDCPISFGEDTFMATKNLARALHDLRELGVQRVWADAICINQADSQERSEQILRMASVYRNASDTIAWIPRKGHDNRSLLSILQKLHDDDSISLVEELTIASFVDNPYWCRVWIIQELTACRNVKLIYGHDLIPFALLEKIISVPVSRWSPNVYMDGNRLGHMNNILRLRTLVRGLQPVGFVEALHTSSISEATDIRDRVYGICSIVRLLEGAGI